MTCPRCGATRLVDGVAIGWRISRRRIAPVRGRFCLACATPVETAPALRLGSLRVEAVSEALRTLQANGDLILVRRRRGVEVVY